jgi:hypothetical protein
VNARTGFMCTALVCESYAIGQKKSGGARRAAASAISIGARDWNRTSTL